MSRISASAISLASLTVLLACSQPTSPENWTPKSYPGWVGKTISGLSVNFSWPTTYDKYNTTLTHVLPIYPDLPDNGKTDLISSFTIANKSATINIDTPTIAPFVADPKYYQELFPSFLTYDYPALLGTKVIPVTFAWYFANNYDPNIAPHQFIYWSSSSTATETTDKEAFLIYTPTAISKTFLDSKLDISIECPVGWNWIARTHIMEKFTGKIISATWRSNTPGSLNLQSAIQP